MFLSLDGIDGVGKSTQLDRLAAWLAERGHEVVTCRDPGTTPLGEQLRELLLAKHTTRIDSRSEMLIYMAARAQLVDEVIRPALAAQKVVLADRFLLANVVYQGHAGGLAVDDVWRVGRVATGDLYPDLVLLLDMPVESARQRLDRPADRMESRGDDYLEAVRRGFLFEARRRSDIALVDAAQDVEEVHEQLCGIVSKVLPQPTARPPGVA